MVRLEFYFVVVGALLDARMDCKTAYRDMFPHKHKSLLPFRIPGWTPDTSAWDESLYPPLPRELTHRRGKPRVHLTSDSPAINGSLITFTARLEFPKCQREDLKASPLYDQDCEDANGEIRSGSVYNRTSLCTDIKRCNVFPDGKPFPLHSDWRRKSYVYIWHTMGQYYETCAGSFSSLTLNTTNMTLGADMMEVLVYRNHERRTYIPLSTDNTVFWITDKIPLAVNIFQKEAANITERIFVKGFDIIFQVQIHDPSNYLKTADAVEFKWDFHDGNQLITHKNVATHTYSMVGNVTVKLVMQAAFRTTCPPPTPTPKHITQTYSTAMRPVSHDDSSPVLKPPESLDEADEDNTDPAVELFMPAGTPMYTTTVKLETTKAGTHTTTAKLETTEVTTPPPTTFQPTDPEVLTSATVFTVPGINSTSVEPTLPPMVQHTHFTECFRYIYGTFEEQIFIIEPHPTLLSVLPNQNVEVTAAKVTDAIVNFVVTCLGSIPTTACTIVADSTCLEVMSIVCSDVKPSPNGCQFSVKHTFPKPGTYCVNITLNVPTGGALSTTIVTISKSSNNDVTKSAGAAEVVLSSIAVLIVIFGCIAFMVYRRNRVYRPVRRSMLEDAEEHTGNRLSKLRSALFQASEERSHLLS